MYIYLFDRPDRLGSNLICIISQICYAHKNRCYIKYQNDDKNSHKYKDSIFFMTIFDFVDKYNEELKLKNPDIERSEYVTIELPKKDCSDLQTMGSLVTFNLESDLISYFRKYIYNHDTFMRIATEKGYKIPFNIENTILIHLRLDDTIHMPDYDGNVCTQHYQKLMNNERLCSFGIHWPYNTQSPLSKEKVENILVTIRDKYPEYGVLLLTSPISNTSNYQYPVIKSEDPSYDLFLLSMCKTAILSRSNFSITSLAFGLEKTEAHIPSWGHMVCYGLNTKYDKNSFKYFY